MLLPYTQAKRILDRLKRLSLGRDLPDASACAQFDRATKQGEDMRHAQKLLSAAVSSIVGKSEEQAIASLFSPGGTHAMKGEFAGSNDFEVLAYLVVLPKYSPLNLNEGLGEVEKWDEDAIKARATRLATEAAKVWTAPQLAADVLDAYRPAAAMGGQQYIITDHPHLVSGPMQGLFEALRKAILALDPCVNEEFLKLYVAYKAETNFVDVVPQAKRLLLVLNLSIEDIEDPKGMCRDISNIGRWGNGDVEVGLSSIDDLPYVLGLIRQSFDHQMGGPQDA